MADLIARAMASALGKTPKIQTWIATDNQTVFTLTNGSYIPNKNLIEVVVGSVPQISGENFTETSSTSFTLNEGIPSGVEVYAKWFETIVPISIGNNPQLSNSTIDLLTGQNTYTTIYTYTASGDISTETVKDSSGNTISTTTYTYVNNVLTSVISVMNGTTTTSTYNYDSNGNLTSVVNAKS